MMPRTLATFGLALAILVLAMVLPPPPSPDAPAQPLDMGGITEVEVRNTAMTDVRFRSDAPPSFEFDDPEATVEISRSGKRLVVTATGHAYLGLELNLPNSVDTLIVPGARVSAREGRGPLEIRTIGQVSWEGDATRLHILDVRGPPPPPATDAARTDQGCYGDCTSFLDIDMGHIGRLDVELAREGVRLAYAEMVDEAHITLGPDAWLSVEMARDLDNIHVHRHAPSTPPDAEAKREISE